MTERRDRTEAVKAAVAALGFDAVGVTTAEAPERGAFLLRWLAEGRHGGMEWLARNAEKRVEPRRVLPEARSVVLVLLNYGDDDRAAGEQQAGACGRVARYARGTDYHDIMWVMLRRAERMFAERFAAKALSYVDTGPVLERELAARAGLGWQGKSTMLVRPTLGTYFFIGELLTDLDLEPDAPEPDRCGTCTRCLQACPTAAITAPYQMDARRCLSYLTIENKGPIPEEFRPLLGDRIYGCDDCLEVCPWNRFARESREARFAGGRWTRRPAMLELLALTEEEFRAVFADSPIKRIKRRGLLRNVCVALGNVGDASCLPALEKAAQDPEPLIAEHARWALERIGRQGQA